MTGWTPDISQGEIISVGVVQGIGLGFLFVPLSATALSTLSPEQRTEGAGFYNLARNVGSSVGISVVNALLTRNTQVNHASIVEHVTPLNRGFARRPAFLESVDGRGKGGTRRRDNTTGTDHRLHRRLQTVDDRDPCGTAAVTRVLATIG